MSNLDGIHFWAEYGLEDIIAHNIINFLKYGLLEIGAYYNVAKDQLSYQGNNESLLLPYTSPSGGTPNFRIYRGNSPDWVWESGITPKYTGGAGVINISGIFVNDTFVSTGTKISGTGYVIDYSRGQILFDNPLPANYTVKVPHTQRWMKIYPADSTEIRKMTTDWFGSGIYTDEHQVFLPATIVGIESYKTIKGLQLGTRSKVSEVRLRFDIVTNNAFDAHKMNDICYFMETKGLPLYDINSAPKPLNISGALGTNPLTWPALVSGYPYGQTARFMENAQVSKINTKLPNIYYYRVFVGLEMNVSPV